MLQSLCASRNLGPIKLLHFELPGFPGATVQPVFLTVPGKQRDKGGQRSSTYLDSVGGRGQEVRAEE